MPYDIIKQGSKYHVIEQTTGESKGASDTRAKAEAHMRALYAHEDDKKPMSSPGTIHKRLEGGIVRLNDSYLPEPVTHGFVDGKRVELRRLGGPVSLTPARRRKPKPVSETRSVGPVPPKSRTSAPAPLTNVMPKQRPWQQRKGAPSRQVGPPGGKVLPGSQTKAQKTDWKALGKVNDAINLIMRKKGIDRAAATKMLRTIGTNRDAYRKISKTTGLKHGGTVVTKTKGLAAKKRTVQG